MVNLVADTIVKPAEIRIDWSTEVFANIGLLSLRFALLELSLQRCLIFWRLYQFVLAHPELTQTEFFLERDKRVKKAFKLTFGGLISELKDLPAVCEEKDELDYLKDSRNFFAHDFFRCEIKKLITEDGKIRLITRIKTLQRRVEVQECKIYDISCSIFQKLHPDYNIESQCELLDKDWEERLGTSAASKFGWECST